MTSDRKTKNLESTALPTISVIVLNYNGRADLETCLASLAELNYPRGKLELIVVDNASTDDSVPWLKQTHPDVHLIESSTNLGFAGGNNLGARSASGSYLAFLNPDTRVDKDWLIALVETVAQGADITCAGSVQLNWAGDDVDYAGRPDDAMDLYPGHTVDTLTSLKAAADVPLLFASGGAMLVRRDVFLELGGFDEYYFLYCEDVDLGWRLWLRGYRVLRSTRSIVYHKRGASSKKLDYKYVMGLAQKYTIYTILKNTETEHLWSILPGVLWYLVDRSRLFADSESLSLGRAMQEITQEMGTIWNSRALTQSERVRADSEIFKLCGHPFGFLFTNANYTRFADYLSQSGEDTCPPSNDPTAVAQHIIKMLYHAYKFNYERLLEQPVTHLIQEPSTVYHSRVWRIKALARRLLRILGSTGFFPALTKRYK
jgi:GT2 family glycosyltransferase